MARTKGSGWGGGVILYQFCPHCEKKKMYYRTGDFGMGDFYCTYCKKWSRGKSDSIKKCFR